jgi:pimeloyl-ACP methyl ester carboxylesterase
MRRSLCCLPLLLLLALAAAGDGPQDNLPDKVRRIPPPGVAIPDADRAELQKGADDLGKEINDLRAALKAQPALLELLPDVQVFHNAVSYALKYDEFYDVKEVAVARKMLKQGFDRARQLRDGKPAWTTATGLVVRGYVSNIDGSVQPYGLVVPASYQANGSKKHRLDFWCHGRGEKLTELSFLDQRMKNPGEFTPPDAFVLHLYGRYCNANKFAGEVDLFEAYDSVRRQYPIDEDRLVIRGFSMGGAACWQFAVHYPSMWAAAAPGAGFAETPEFLDFFQKEKVKPTWYEEKLWHLYNSTDYAINLFNCPTVAYSGEIDSQKQAADVMAREMAKEGLKLTHIIGPKTAHKYHPESKAEINRLIDAIVAKGRNPAPERIRFTTWTLRYNRCFFVQVDELGEHWKRARVNVDVCTPPPQPKAPYLTVDTVNVTAWTLDTPAKFFAPAANLRIRLDGQDLDLPKPAADGSLRVHFRKAEGKWQIVAAPDAGGLAKKHGLQGPIDDAFLDRFIMVRPTGKAMNDKVGKWAKAEMAHAIDHWRRQFRGEAPVKDDNDITDADIAGSNLILWGDPSSNKVLARIAGKLPIRWETDAIVVGDRKFDTGHHVPVLVYPNPLNPKKYVVLNSGFTFREYDYLNNARQVPKLPDFAVVDINVPVSSRAPGGIVDAGFFDEHWQLTTKKQ